MESVGKDECAGKKARNLDFTQDSLLLVLYATSVSVFSITSLCGCGFRLPLSALPLVPLGVLLALHRLGLAEEHRDAPDTGKPHERVDDAADRAHLPAKEERHAVKAEQADAAPVECADDGKRQRDLIDDHEITSFWYQ